MWLISGTGRVVSCPTIAMDTANSEPFDISSLCDHPVERLTNEHLSAIFRSPVRFTPINAVKFFNLYRTQITELSGDAHTGIVVALSSATHCLKTKRIEDCIANLMCIKQVTLEELYKIIPKIADTKDVKIRGSLLFAEISDIIGTGPLTPIFERYRDFKYGLFSFKASAFKTNEFLDGHPTIERMRELQALGCDLKQHRWFIEDVYKNANNITRKFLDYYVEIGLGVNGLSATEDRHEIPPVLGHRVYDADVYDVYDVVRATQGFNPYAKILVKRHHNRTVPSYSFYSKRMLTQFMKKDARDGTVLPEHLLAVSHSLPLDQMIKKLTNPLFPRKLPKDRSKRDVFDKPSWRAPSLDDDPINTFFAALSLTQDSNGNTPFASDRMIRTLKLD